MNCDCDCGYRRGKDDAEHDGFEAAFFLGMLAVPALVGVGFGIWKIFEFIGGKF